MAGQVLIVFRHHLAQQGQPRPRNHRKIVMLRVVADVKHEKIRPAYVVIGLQSIHELVVFGNEVRCEGVQAN